MSANESSKEGLSRRMAIAAGLAPLVVPRHVLGGPNYQAPSDKLAIAAVGVGGMGKNYLNGCKDEANRRFVRPRFRVRRSGLQDLPIRPGLPRFPRRCSTRSRRTSTP